MSDLPLLSRMDRFKSLLAAQSATLSCPVCRGRLLPPEGSSIRCARGHCFDISRRGYVNLAQAGTLPHYDRALFLSRRAVLEAGFYDPLLETLREAVRAECRRLCRPVSLLDAGCGEGYYAAALAEGEDQVFAIDLCRDAVVLAAQRPEPVCWCVADLTRLPFADGSLDVLLDVLTPASYGEFHRVLRPGGLIVKVVPGCDYLREIREAVHQPPYDNNDVVAYFHAHMDDVTNTPVRYVRKLDESMRAPFFHMTPLTVGKKADEAALCGISQITLDLCVLTGRFGANAGGLQEDKR